MLAKVNQLVNLSCINPNIVFRTESPIHAIFLNYIITTSNTQWLSEHVLPAFLCVWTASLGSCRCWCWNTSSNPLCPLLLAGEAQGNFGRGDESKVIETWLQYPWFPSFEVTSVWLPSRGHYWTQGGLWFRKCLTPHLAPLYLKAASGSKVQGFCPNLCGFPKLQSFLFNSALINKPSSNCTNLSVPFIFFI